MSVWTSWWRMVWWGVGVGWNYNCCHFNLCLWWILLVVEIWVDHRAGPGAGNKKIFSCPSWELNQNIFGLETRSVFTTPNEQSRATLVLSIQSTAHQLSVLFDRRKIVIYLTRFAMFYFVQSWITRCYESQSSINYQLTQSLLHEGVTRNKVHTNTQTQHRRNVSFSNQLSLLSFELPTHIWVYSLMRFRALNKNGDIFYSSKFVLHWKYLLFSLRVTDNRINNIKILMFIGPCIIVIVEE